MGSVSGPHIVVGVDGSAGSKRALRWAAEEARKRHGRVQVVLAWEPAYLATYSPVTAHADHAEQERAAHALLADTLRSVFGVDIHDHVTAKVVQGIAERVLVEESRAADLLVLGSTQARERACQPVGPVIRGCLHQARCPVMIIGSCEAARPEPVLTGS